MYQILLERNWNKDKIYFQNILVKIKTIKYKATLEFDKAKVKYSNSKYRFLWNFQVLKATTMNSVMYLQELKTKNTQVDVDCFYQINIKTPHFRYWHIKNISLVLDISFFQFCIRTPYIHIYTLLQIIAYLHMIINKFGD